jgi:hypothetical protein
MQGHIEHLAQYSVFSNGPMYSEGHILSAPGLLATFVQGLLIRRALPLSASSGAFSFILSILW